MPSLTDLLGVRLPLIQAPMAGSSGVRLAIAVSAAGGLGSLPCAMLTPDQIRAAAGAFRAASDAPLNLNFFAHESPAPDVGVERAWSRALTPLYDAFGLTPPLEGAAARAPFDETLCTLVEELRPQVVSFHFGLPREPLVARVRAAGAKILSSATTIDEARWLEARGCDAIIAQGAEAGGHRGLFLSGDVGTQVGTMALTPQIVDAVKAPVIASGGLGDRRGVTAAMALGAGGVQIGTAYLLCPECDTAPLHRAALKAGGETALTNLFTGRPARGLMNRLMRELGPLRADVPAFPRAGAFLAPLRAAAEARGSAEFSPLWAGQAFPLAQERGALEVTRALMGV